MKKETFTKDMNIGEIIEKFPQSAEVMLKYGLHCIGCHVSPYESLKMGCKGHGISDKDTDKMVKEINELYQKSQKDKK